MHCENCGEPIKEFTCQWCEEEAYICEEFSGTDVNYSEEFLLTVEEQRAASEKRYQKWKQQREKEGI